MRECGRREAPALLSARPRADPAVSSGQATATRTAAGVTVPKPSLLARALPAFSGTVGLVIKLVLLAITNAIGLWGGIGFLGEREQDRGALRPRRDARDRRFVYLVPDPGPRPASSSSSPATVFLIGFQLIPIVYNASVAFSNWSTGHNLTKEEAIQTIQETSLGQPPNGAFYTMTPAREDGHLALLLVDEGEREGLRRHRGRARAASLPRTSPSRTAPITQAQGYDVLTGSELAGIDQELAGLVVPAGGNSFVRAEGLSTALELTADAPLRPEGRHVHEHRDRCRLLRQRQGVVRDRLRARRSTRAGGRTSASRTSGRSSRTRSIRDPFLSTFVWTFSYALLSVVLTFFAGLFIAIALNHDGLRFQRLQRSILILPYAIPAFLSLLVWRGLLNDDFGVVNSDPAGRRALALRPVLGARLVPARQLLARDPVHVPHLHRGAPVDPRGDGRSRTRRRRLGAPGVPQDHPAAAARRGRAAPDRLVRVQLQQLQRDLLPHGGRAVQRGDQSVAGVDRPARELHVQGRVPDRARRRLRARGVALDPHLPHRRPRSPRSPSSGRRPWRTSRDVRRREHPGPRERRRAGRRGRARDRGGGSGRGAEAGAPAPARGLVALPRRSARDGVRALPRRVRGLGRVQPGAVPEHGLRDPRGGHARQLPRDPVRPARALPELVPQHDDHRDRDRGRDRPAGRARRVRVLALPLQGTPVRDALAPPDPDVPAVPRGRRDLPDHARHLRRLPRHRAQHAHRA